MAILKPSPSWPRTAVLQHQLGDSRAPNAHLVLGFAAGDAGHGPVYQEGGGALGADAGFGDGHHYEVIALLRAQVGDEALGTVEDVIIPVLHRPGLQTAGVGAGPRLGEGKAAQLALGSLGQILGLLLRSSFAHQNICGEVVHIQNLGGGGTALGHLGHRQRLGDLIVHPGAAVFLRDAQLHDTDVHQPLDVLLGIPAGLVDLVRQGLNGALCILLGDLLDGKLFFRKLEHGVLLSKL